MRRILLILLFIPFTGSAQNLKSIFKYSTMYAAINGGTSLGDDQIWSVTSGFLEEQVIKTPLLFTLTY